MTENVSVEYTQLDCELCIYNRGGLCRQHPQGIAILANKTSLNPGPGCSDGQWVIRKPDGKLMLIDWERYWYDYDEPQEDRNPETNEWEPIFPAHWKEFELIDWRNQS